MEPFQPKLILVPTDFSEPAAHALRYASALGERFGAHLLLLYADPFVLPMDFSTTAATVAIGCDQMIEETRERLQAYAEENISTRVLFDVRVIADSPVDAIIGQACDVGADLIVMGTHGRTGVRRLIVGSVTEAVIRLATTPVIAVNSAAGESAEVQKVLCPVSFTAESRTALRYAAELAKGPLVLFRGIEDEELQGTIDELIKLQDWAPKELAHRCEMKIGPSFTPADDIVEFARLTNAELIAIGVPAGRSIADVLQGTIAEQVVQRSGCPVLAVNAATAGRIAPQRDLEFAAAMA
jgi:nucleotide-binding universal stress UspA family protein